MLEILFSECEVYTNEAIPYIRTTNQPRYLFEKIFYLSMIQCSYSPNSYLSNSRIQEIKVKYFYANNNNNNK